MNNANNPDKLVDNALAQAKKLQTDRQYRQVSGLFWTEGVRNFVQVCDHGYEIAKILFSEKLLTAPLARKLVRQKRRAGIETISLTPEQFRSISRTERASGVAAIVKQRWFNLEEIGPKEGLCWIAVENIRFSGNLGALIRTSEAVGGAGFLLIGNSIDPFEPDIIRSSMSGIFNQRLIRTNISALRQWIENHHIQVIGASPDGQRDLHEFKYPQASLLLLGEERLGLTEKQRSLCQHLIRIPMVGQADSLNLAVAGSLLLYEIYRARRF